MAEGELYRLFNDIVLVVNELIMVLWKFQVDGISNRRWVRSC